MQFALTAAAEAHLGRLLGSHPISCLRRSGSIPCPKMKTRGRQRSGRCQQQIAKATNHKFGETANSKVAGTKEALTECDCRAGWPTGWPIPKNLHTVTAAQISASARRLLFTVQRDSLLKGKRPASIICSIGIHSHTLAPRSRYSSNSNSHLASPSERIVETQIKKNSALKYCTQQHLLCLSRWNVINLLAKQLFLNSDLLGNSKC